MGVVRALAARAGNNASEEAALLWQRVSVALQTGVANTLVSSVVDHALVAAAGLR